MERIGQMASATRTRKKPDRLDKQILEKFCEYLNLWWNQDPMNKDEQDPYKPEQFYAEEYSSFVSVDFPEAEMRILNVDDGDEGGGSRLYVHLDTYSAFDWVVHEFDTIPVMMWTLEEGFRKP
jgi:hypothetical protein